MGDTRLRLQVLILTVIFEIAHLAHSLVDVERAGWIDQRYTGAVISAIFETVQAFYQHVVDVTISYISYYSTHKYIVVIPAANRISPPRSCFIV